MSVAPKKSKAKDQRDKCSYTLLQAKQQQKEREGNF